MKELTRILFSLFLSIQGTTDIEKEAIIYSQCGMNSLYSCLSYLDVECSYDDIYANIQSDGENRVDLYQLAKYAESKGLYYKPIIRPKKIDEFLDFLNPNTAVVIQFYYVLESRNIKTSHIAALIRPSNNEIKVLDYPKSQSFSLSEITATDLSGCEGGFVLSKTPFPSQNYFVIILFASVILGLSILFFCLNLLKRKVSLPNVKSKFKK